MKTIDIIRIWNAHIIHFEQLKSILEYYVDENHDQIKNWPNEFIIFRWAEHPYMYNKLWHIIMYPVPIP